MVGIYISIFIILLITFYLVILNIRNQNKILLNITNKLNMIHSENNNESFYIDNIDDIKNIDDIGNIYNDYYNNIDYNGQINPYNNNYKPRELDNLRKCQVPTLNTEQCYKSRYYECPIVNGSLLQCTNNYIPKPSEFNADCGNRTFDMTPYPWKISENCYYNKIGFDRNKEFRVI